MDRNINRESEIHLHVGSLPGLSRYLSPTDAATISHLVLNLAIQVSPTLTTQQRTFAMFTLTVLFPISHFTPIHSVLGRPFLPSLRSSARRPCQSVSSHSESPTHSPVRRPSLSLSLSGLAVSGRLGGVVTRESALPCSCLA